MLCTLILHHFCRTQNRKFYPVIHWMNYLTKLDRSVYFLNSNTPESTPQPLNLLKLNTLPRATFGRGSGRKGINFSEYPTLHRWNRRALISLQAIQANRRRSFSELLNSPQLQPCTGFSLLRSDSYRGRPCPWVPSFLSSLSDSGCFCKSWLKVLKSSYLQYISKGGIMGDIKSFPPLVKVWKPRPKGDKFKTTLDKPTSQVMSNVTLFEKSRQVGLSGKMKGMAIATLTLASQGGAA